MRTNRAKIALLTIALAAAPAAFADTNSGTSDMGITIGPEASITAVGTTSNLAPTGTTFADFTGSTSFTYKVRTTTSGGTGAVTATVGAFDGSSGIVIANDLTYTSSKVGAAVGTPISSALAAASGTATNILTFGADTHSNNAGDDASISWVLVNKPSYKTGGFTALVTLTISAT